MPGGIREYEHKLMKATSGIPSPPHAGNDGMQLNSKAVNQQPVMSTGKRVMLATMLMEMRRETHRKPMMNQH
jgi:hypothetical protein